MNTNGTTDRRAGAALLAATAAACLIIVSGGPPALADDDSGGSAPPDPAAIQLALDYGVDIEEASARIRRQVSVDAFYEQVRRNAPSFAGMRIDHRDGGRVVVALSGNADREGVTAAAQDFELDQLLRFVPAERTASSLLAVQRRIQASFGDGSRGMSVEVDVERNKVLVRYPSRRDAEQSDYLSRLRSQHEFVVEFEEVSGDGVAPAACTVTGCATPLRGGIQISSSIGSCTSGFPAVSNSDGRLYLITAGHCVKPNPSAGWSQKLGDGSTKLIGTTQNWRVDTGGDYAILRVDDVAGWRARGWVYVGQASSPGYPTATNEAYPIVGEGSYGSVPTGGSPAGKYLCHTGFRIAEMNFGATRCGQLGGSGISVTYTTGETVNGLARFNAPTCRGDSGGPVFVGNRAYGIVAAADGTAYPNTGTAMCFTQLLYQGMGGIQSQQGLNVTPLHN